MQLFSSSRILPSTRHRGKAADQCPLKIDRAFVNGVTQDKSACAILESSVELAKKLKMNIVAEGVETQEDWDLIESPGCDQIQGCFIVKPMPAEALRA